MKNEVENKNTKDGRWLKVYEEYEMVIVETYSESSWLEADEAIELAHAILEVAHITKFKQEAGL